MRWDRTWRRVFSSLYHRRETVHSHVVWISSHSPRKGEREREREREREAYIRLRINDPSGLDFKGERPATSMDGARPRTTKRAKREEKKGIPKRTIDRTRMKGCPTLFRNPSGAPSNVRSGAPSKRSCSYRIPYLLSDESNSYYHHCHRRGPDHHTYTTYMYGSHGGGAARKVLSRATHRPSSFSLSGGVIAVDPFLVGEKDRLIRDSISIRPTVTIFTNNPTFGCGGRSSGMKELHRREQGGNPFNLSLCTATRAAKARLTLHVFLSIFAKGIDFSHRAFVSFVFVVGEVTRKVAENKLLPVSQTASCEALAASVLTINIGGFAWQRQV
ncbi:hypothetical protein ALC56_06263 [Trachymyrmex septentrionalis]|uniref:Uncharacterized protein n=1 Tax=Trachymyrmex septentrionalis TaxID=34720 RepID=A0A195FGI0_9HYME|nr:hypothetical protein ALC56_06263 [Trachymyrmex septentrionalis]